MSIVRQQESIWQGLNGWDIVLCSQSPRRVELLGGLGIKFRQQVLSDIDETYPETLPALEVAGFIAKKKAEIYRERISENTLIFTADTVVIVDESVLGKPSDEEEALTMLRSLQGRRHKVVTGICIASRERLWSSADIAEVELAPLSDEELRYYITTHKPYDKAGAYGIQEWIGYRAISRIDGSFYNVMGLPTALLAEGLRTFMSER